MREEAEGDEEIREVQRKTLTSCMDEMRQTLGHLEPMEPCDVCKEWSVTTQDNEGLTTTTHIPRVHQVWSTFHCRVSCAFVLILVFHVVIGVGTSPPFSRKVLLRQLHFHHAYAIPSTKFFSSGCCSPDFVPVIVKLNLYSQNSCILHIAKNGVLLRVLCFTLPPSVYSRTAVSCERS